MSAKLLEFYGLNLNREGVIYFLMTDGKVDTFRLNINLGDALDDPEFKVGGILFGAQASLITRRVVNTRMYNPRSIP